MREGERNPFVAIQVTPANPGPCFGKVPGFFIALRRCAMAELLGTREAAKRLNIRPSRLNYLVWDGRVPTPSKIGGRFVWDEAAVREAARVLAGGGKDGIHD